MADNHLGTVLPLPANRACAPCGIQLLGAPDRRTWPKQWIEPPDRVEHLSAEGHVRTLDGRSAAQKGPAGEGERDHGFVDRHSVIRRVVKHDSPDYVAERRIFEGSPQAV